MSYERLDNCVNVHNVYNISCAWCLIRKFLKDIVGREMPREMDRIKMLKSEIDAVPEDS